MKFLGKSTQTPLNSRLAQSMQKQSDANHHQHHQQQPIATPEIQSSIKEVTSAIVHYVNDQTNRGSRSRSVSPSTRFDSPSNPPQTPLNFPLHF
jgi:hypothetical protein